MILMADALLNMLAMLLWAALRIRLGWVGGAHNILIFGAAHNNNIINMPNKDLFLLTEIPFFIIIYLMVNIIINTEPIFNLKN